MGISRVEYDGKLLIDISSDTVKSENLLVGATAHDSNGDPVEGGCDYDMKTKDFTAFASDIRKGKTAGVNGQEITGSLEERDAAENIISKKDGVFTIPDGIHDGRGTVKISPTEMNKLKPENIRENVEILGVVGTMTGNEGENPSPKVTVEAPLKEDLTILPEGDYTCFKEVLVKKVPYVETDMTASNKGKWIAIG